MPYGKNPELKIGNRDELQRTLSDHRDAIMQLEMGQKDMLSNVDKRIRRATQYAAASPADPEALFDSPEQARCFGLLVVRATATDHSLRQYAEYQLERDFRHETRDIGGSDSLVPHQFSDRVKRLIERFGVFARRAYRMPMSGDKLTFIKQVGEIDVFKLRRGKKGDESDPGFAPVKLNAEDFGTLTYYPRELEADAMVAVGELVMRSIAFAFGRKIDQMAFMGDGSDDFGNVMGIVPLLKQINGIDDGGGLVLADGNVGDGWNGITLANFMEMMTRIPSYDGPGEPAW